MKHDKLDDDDERLDYVYARQLVCAYFRMLTIGCGRDACRNLHCRSSPGYTLLTANDAALRSIQLATVAPVPICLAGACVGVGVGVDVIVATERLAGAPLEVVTIEEERPEVDEDDEAEEASAAEMACSPRRRLSHAMEMDMVLNASDTTAKREEECNSSYSETLDGRHTSLPKQKLLNALQKSFPAMPTELHVAKKQ